MLFNSFFFIFLFLPITLFIFYRLARTSKGNALLWLICSSIAFYAWNKPINAVLIVASMLFNYWLGQRINRNHENTKVSKLLLIIGLVFNLTLLAYFKYFGFAIANIVTVTGWDLTVPAIALPLGISFFTFQQVAYIVDTYRGETKEVDLRKYMLFVCFFPQLIAGPIESHKELLPQFEQESIFKFNQTAFSIGLTVFIFGLFKKMIFADRIAEYSNLAFGAASSGVHLTFSEAWVAAIGYSLQLYFDFSGYCDMAVGIGYMFGIRLHQNFNSPYKAISIVDFWRRWHITLSHFLRDYLYIPMGGSRKGNRHINLLLTMLLGGLWHGAGWTFIFWGGLHGMFLVINHAYRNFRIKLGHDLKQDNWMLKSAGQALTLIAVIISWIFFKATSFAIALSVLSSMFDFNHLNLPQFIEPYVGFLRAYGVEFAGFTTNVGISQKYATFGILLVSAIALFTPNTQQWMTKYNPAIGKVDASSKFWQAISYTPNKIWSILLAIATTICILSFTRVSEFLYFQF